MRSIVAICSRSFAHPLLFFRSVVSLREDKEYPLHAKLAAIKPASAATASDYVAICFAGGHACCVDFPHARELKKLTAQIYEQGGVVGAVCHGPAIFENLTLSSGSSLIAGKEVTGFAEKGEKEMNAMDWLDKFNYKTMEQMAKAEGAVWKEPDSAWGDYTVVSERVVTGVNPASAKSLAEKILELLPAEEQTKSGETSEAAVKTNTDAGLTKTDLGAATGSSATTAPTTTTTAGKTELASTELEKEKATYSGEQTATI